MVAPGKGSGDGGGVARLRCCHLRGGDGGCWPINAWPARKVGGARQRVDGAISGGWVEPVIHGCGGSATHGGSYLATPPSPSCSPAATHTISHFPFNAGGHFCSHPASLRYPCNFLATCVHSYGHLKPSWACGLLG